jgi:hypothetical protein
MYSAHAAVQEKQTPRANSALRNDKVKNGSVKKAASDRGLF